MTKACILLFLMISCSAYAQNSMQLESLPLAPIDFDTLSNENYAHNTDQQAKLAVGKIMKYIGLPQNFNVISEDVPTAVAYVKHKERYIGYNDDFIRSMFDSTHTDWSSTSILAHEIAHHLAGHTLNVKKGSPGDELEADVFSGFILFRMGATLDQALAAMREFKPAKDDDRYPPKKSRLMAIESGWNEAKQLSTTNGADLKPTAAERKKQCALLYEIVFAGDENTYYVDDKNRVIWFDNYGTPISIGSMQASEKSNYQWVYTYLGTNYGVDEKGRIWLMTDHGAMIQSGQVYVYKR